MNLLFPVAIAIAWVSQPAMASVSPTESSATAAECPAATSHFARKGGLWNGGPMKPQKLAELPPADAYAAVFRHDERGCMVPVMYRDVSNPRRR